RGVSRLERPDEVSQAAVRAQFERCPGVGDGRGDFPAVTNDPRVAQQAFDVAVAEGSDSLRIEALKSRAKGGAFAQDGDPRQPRLKRFETESLKQTRLVAAGHAPLGVVVLIEQRIARSPQRTRQTVYAQHHIGPGAHLGVYI